MWGNVLWREGLVTSHLVGGLPERGRWGGQRGVSEATLRRPEMKELWLESVIL